MASGFRGWRMMDRVSAYFLKYCPAIIQSRTRYGTIAGNLRGGKIKYTLPSKFGDGLGIIFEDGAKGRIVT